MPPTTNSRTHQDEVEMAAYGQSSSTAGGQATRVRSTGSGSRYRPSLWTVGGLTFAVAAAGMGTFLIVRNSQQNAEYQVWLQTDRASNQERGFSQGLHAGYKECVSQLRPNASGTPLNITVTATPTVMRSARALSDIDLRSLAQGSTALQEALQDVLSEPLKKAGFNGKEAEEAINQILSQVETVVEKAEAGGMTESTDSGAATTLATSYMP